MTSEEVLAWVRMVEAERLQKAILAIIQVTKEFDTVKCVKTPQVRHSDTKTNQTMRKCQYCGSHYKPSQWMATARCLQAMENSATLNMYIEA